MKEEGMAIDVKEITQEELPPLEDLGSLIEPQGSMDLLPAPQPAVTAGDAEMMLPILQSFPETGSDDPAASTLLAYQEKTVD